MIKTISLTANIETEVELTGGCHVSVENRGTGIIYASKSGRITADSDGVTAIDSGSTKILRNVAQYRKNDDNKSYDYYGKIYLLSASDTKAEIQTANDLNFFSRKNSAKGGETYDDTEIKNEIADLQNSKVDKVIGKGLSTNDYTTEEKEKLAALENYDDTMIKSDIANKVENDIFVAENLIPFPYKSSGGTVYGIESVVNDDGSITLNGTVTLSGSATGSVIFRLVYPDLNEIKLENKKYIFDQSFTPSISLRIDNRIYKKDGSYINIQSYEDRYIVIDNTDGVYDYISHFSIYAAKDFNIDNLTIKPMLEVGSVSHEYQPYKLSRKAMRDDINALMARLT